MTAAWDDEIDETIGGDLTPCWSTRTGAVPCRDRACAIDRGTVTFTTSLGFLRKLDRIAIDRRVALA